MKTLDEVRKIMVEREMRELKFSQTPSWIDKNNTEGVIVDFSTKSIISFWVRDGERVMGEPASEKIVKTIEILKNEKTEEPKAQTQDIAKLAPHTIESNRVVMLPTVITKELIDAYKQHTTIERMLLFQNTAPEYVQRVAIGKDENGVMQYAPYVPINIMLLEANIAFLFDWRFIKEGMNIGETAVAVWGTLYANVDGIEMQRPGEGYELLNKKMTAQLAIKSATSDAIKKALSRFGFNSDVYRGEV